MLVSGKIAVLCSGGIDSAIHLEWARKNLFMARGLMLEPIYFHVGQCYAERELRFARKVAASADLTLREIHLPGLEEDRETGHIPMRNLFFLLAVAASQEPKYDGVVFGMLKAESSEDKNPAFVRHVQSLIDTQFAKTMYRKERRDFIIYTPFQNYTKTQMIAWYLNRQTPASTDDVMGDAHAYVAAMREARERLTQTVACYVPDGPMCGECLSCFNRWLAFDRLGFPLEQYQMHPAEGMLTRLRFMKYDKHDKNWAAISFGKAWKRRQWVWESFMALNQYCHRVYGVGVWRHLKEST